MSPLPFASTYFSATTARHSGGSPRTSPYPLQRSLIAPAAAKPGGAATAAEAGKRAKYGAACAAANFKFVPIVMDMFGAWGASATPFLRMLAKRAGERDDLSPGEAVPIAMRVIGTILAGHIAEILMANAAAADVAANTASDRAADLVLVRSAHDADAADIDDEEQGDPVAEEDLLASLPSSLVASSAPFPASAATADSDTDEEEVPASSAAAGVPHSG